MGCQSSVKKGFYFSIGLLSISKSKESHGSIRFTPGSVEMPTQW